MRRKVLLAAIMVGLSAFCGWFALRRVSTHNLTLHAYFRHVQNVKKGMQVCVDGVQVGSVDSVTVRPELGDRPVEVVLSLSTPYELHIPKGSTAQVAEPGIMRPTIVDIDTREAQGPAITNGGAIEGLESKDDQTAHALGIVVKALADQPKSESTQEKSSGDPSKAKPKRPR